MKVIVKILFPFFLLCILASSGCKKAPTSTNDDDVIEVPDDEPKGPEIITLKTPTRSFEPLERVVYEYDELEDLLDLDEEDIFEETENGILFKRYDVIVGEDTLKAIVWDELESRPDANDSSFDFYTITIPLLENGTYNFYIDVSDEYRLEGEFSVLNTRPISDPTSYVSQSTDQLNSIIFSTTNYLNTVVSENEFTESYHIDDIQRDLFLIDSIQTVLNEEILNASSSELEKLSYFFQNYEELINDELQLKSTDLRNKNTLLKNNADYEQDYEAAKARVEQSISTMTIAKAVDEWDWENISESSSRMWDAAVSLIPMTAALNHVSGLNEALDNVFIGIEDRFSFDLETESKDKKQKKQLFDAIDTVRVESGVPIFIKVKGTYINLIEQYTSDYNSDLYNTPIVSNSLSNAYNSKSLLRKFRDLKNANNIWTGFFKTSNELALIESEVNVNYLELDNSDLRVASASKDTERNAIKIESDIENATIISELGLSYILDDQEVDLWKLGVNASSCPDFSTFMTGQWLLKYYGDGSNGGDDSTRGELSQLDRVIFYEDGKWEGKETRNASESEWSESFETGTWVGKCEEGEARLVMYNNFFTNIAYVLYYEKDKTLMIGYLGNYSLELRKGW